MNHGKAANPLRSINHRLSVANEAGDETFGTLWNRHWFADLILLVLWRFKENGEPRANMNCECLRVCLGSSLTVSKSFAESQKPCSHLRTGCSGTVRRSFGL
ncbi:hypothetical protein AVEN_20792-1 [Araneus ventricosus]|uniref:Uncharacterized protein n=1 Tax=Araneus ventricosus TaxID=182803 RepID=A0A4Y2IXM2_ARAVE|nr:hypothetical protein AVEN_20792-1 [Araneus ventricosus]